jgi:hypothetical protein
VRPQATVLLSLAACSGAPVTSLAQETPDETTSTMRERTVTGQFPMPSSQISEASDPVCLSVVRSPALDQSRCRRSPDAGESRRVLVSVETLRFAPTPLRGAAGLDADCAPALRAAMGERPVGNAGPVGPMPLGGTPRGDQTQEHVV